MAPACNGPEPEQADAIHPVIGSAIVDVTWSIAAVEFMSFVMCVKSPKTIEYTDSVRVWTAVFFIIHYPHHEKHVLD